MVDNRTGFSCVGIGQDRTAWAIDENHRLRQLFGQASVALNDARPVSRISVASVSQVWGLDSSGQPLSLQPDSGLWSNMGTATLLSIDGAPDGTVCGVELVHVTPPPGTPPGTRPPPPEGRAVQWNGGSWEKMDDDDDQQKSKQPVRQIAVGDRNSIWSTDSNGMVLRRQGRNNWQPMPALPSFTTPQGKFYPTAVRLCAGTDGTLCAVGSFDYVYRLQPGASAWDYLSSGEVTEIAGTNGKDYVGLTKGQMSPSGKSINEVLVWGYSLQTMPAPPPPVAVLSWRQGVAGLGSFNAPAIAMYNRGLYLAGQSYDDNPAARFFHWSCLSWDGSYFNANAFGTTNSAIGSTCALASFRGALYCAFQAYDPGHALCVTRSYDGAQWWPPVSIPNILIGGVPALAAFQDKLYCAFQANDPSNTLYFGNTDDGENWPVANPLLGTTIASAPALAVFKGKLYCAFEDNVTHALGVISSADGQNWESAVNGISSAAIGGPPALVAFNGRLYCGYRANDGKHPLCMISSVDGENWETPHRYDELASPLTRGAQTFFAVGKTLYALLATSDGTRSPISLYAADA